MANLGKTFDATAHETMGSFEPLPEGDYRAVITDSEMKRTKAGDGEMLVLKFEVIDGEHKGRNIWARLNLDNPNKTAVDIAERELATICKAIGKLSASDSSELHNIPMQITLGIEPGRGQYGPSNRIKMYEALGGSSPANQAAPQPVQAGTVAKKPWE